MCRVAALLMALLILALLVLSGIFTPAEAQFGNGYTYRRAVDFVDAEVIGGPHPNYPVLISSTLLDLRTRVPNGGKVENADGYDIIFTSDETGTTQLAHEIESYVSSTGEIVFWVRVESLVATTKIYMFYGNSGIATFQGDATRHEWVFVGVEQIADALAGRSGIDAIHLMTHGSQAGLQLGTARKSYV